MLLARRNNDSDWLSNFFDDTLFNTAQPAVLLKLVNFTSDFMLITPPVFHTFFPRQSIYLSDTPGFLYSLYIHDSIRKPELLHLSSGIRLLSRYVSKFMTV